MPFSEMGNQEYNKWGKIHSQVGHEIYIEGEISEKLGIFRPIGGPKFNVLCYFRNVAQYLM